MILHDIANVTFLESIDSLDGTPRTATISGISCEVQPIDSEPAIAAGAAITRYKFITTTDLAALAATQAASWKASKPASRGVKSITIVYMGKNAVIEGGFEVHKVLGRVHHYEAVLKDFSPIALVP